MIQVKMIKIDDLNGNLKDSEVNIKVFMNLPQVEADPFAGILFKNAPQIEISSTSVKFSEMKNIMNRHELKNWNEVKVFIEDKYNEYYEKLFQGMNFKSVVKK